MTSLYSDSNLVGVSFISAKNFIKSFLYDENLKYKIFHTLAAVEI